LAVKKTEKILPVKKQPNQESEENVHFSFDAIHCKDNESWTIDNTERHKLLPVKKTAKLQPVKKQDVKEDLYVSFNTVHGHVDHERIEDNWIVENTERHKLLSVKKQKKLPPVTKPKNQKSETNVHISSNNIYCNTDKLLRNNSLNKIKK